jgi:hypothetical protein
MDKIESISFSGGGWQGIYYYLGIIRYIHKYYPDKKFITLGTSAGALMSMVLQLLQYNLIDLDLFENKLELFENDIRPNPFFLKNKLKKFLENFIEISEEEFLLFNDYNYISYSERIGFKIKNKLIKPISFNQLKETLLYSSMMPILVGFNINKFDGFFSNNQPILDENTLKINCIPHLFSADIRPSKIINPLNIFKIPCKTKKEEIINMGYNDIKEFCKKQ